MRTFSSWCCDIKEQNGTHQEWENSCTTVNLQGLRLSYVPLAYCDATSTRNRLMDSLTLCLHIWRSFHSLSLHPSTSVTASQNFHVESSNHLGLGLPLSRRPRMFHYGDLIIGTLWRIGKISPICSRIICLMEYTSIQLWPTYSTSKSYFMTTLYGSPSSSHHYHHWNLPSQTLHLSSLD